MKNIFSRLYLSSYQKLKNENRRFSSFTIVLLAFVLFIIVTEIRTSLIPKPENGPELFTEHIALIEKKVNSLCSNFMMVTATNEFSQHYARIVQKQKASNNSSLLNLTGTLHNNHPTIDKKNVTTGEYWQIYNKFHPILKTYAEKFNILDITIVDPDKTYILYSVHDQPYTLKPLQNRQISNTRFINTIERVGSRSMTSSIQISEFASEKNQTELYIAAPVGTSQEIVGYLVFRFTLNQFEGSLALQSYLEQ